MQKPMLAGLPSLERIAEISPTIRPTTMIGPCCFSFAIEIVTSLIPFTHHTIVYKSIIA